jgi:RNase P/RNase MRP subunit POP5
MVRLKFRIVLAQVDFGAGEVAPGGVKMRDLEALLRAAHEELFGAAGLAQLAWGLSVRHYCAVTQLLLVRCPRDAASALEASIAAVTRVAGRPAAIHCLATYGSVRTAVAGLPPFLLAAARALVAGRRPDPALVRGPAGAFDAALGAAGALETAVMRSLDRDVPRPAPASAPMDDDGDDA